MGNDSIAAEEWPENEAQRPGQLNTCWLELKANRDGQLPDDIPYVAP